MTASGSTPTRDRTTRLWFAASVIVLAAAMQFHGTLLFYGTFIRVTIADLVVPIVLAAVAVAFIRGHIGVPASRIPGLWVWLAVLTAWMLVALLIGREVTGGWQSWALFNKVLGWMVLLGYLALGKLAATVDGGRYRHTFLKALFASTWAIAAYGVSVYVLMRTGVLMPDANPTCDIRYLYFSEELRAELPDIWLFMAGLSPECTGRLHGFMANPNAYGVLVAVVLALQMPFMKRGELFSKRLHVAGFGIALTALIFTGSRTAWLAFIVGMAALHFLGEIRYRQAGLGTLIAAAIILAVAVEPSTGLLRSPGGPGSDADGRPRALTYIVNSQLVNLQTTSFQMRIEQARRAVELWRARPVFGIGLGGFLWDQNRGQEPSPSTLHNTALWLLTETGLVGLLLFTGFYLACLRALLPGLAGRRSAIAVGGLATVIVFAGASLGMEVMYQRHFWFLLGFALALPRSATAAAEGPPHGPA